MKNNWQSKAILIQKNRHRSNFTIKALKRTFKNQYFKNLNLRKSVPRKTETWVIPSLTTILPNCPKATLTISMILILRLCHGIKAMIMTPKMMERSKISLRPCLYLKLRPMPNLKRIFRNWNTRSGSWNLRRKIKHSQKSKSKIKIKHLMRYRLKLAHCSNYQSLRKKSWK